MKENFEERHMNSFWLFHVRSIENASIVKSKPFLCRFWSIHLKFNYIMLTFALKPSSSRSLWRDRVNEYILVRKGNKTKRITYKQIQNGSHASVVVYILILMTFYSLYLFKPVFKTLSYLRPFRFAFWH